MVKVLNKDDDFFDIVEKGIILVDFHAEWCAPCKMEDIILDNIDFIDILKVDVDEFKDLAIKFGVMSIPTLCFFKDGLLMQKEIGYRTDTEIRDIYKKINGD